MKLCLIILSIFFTTNNLCAQKLKKKTEVNGNFKEVYFVDKKTKIRQGKSFVINTKTGDTISLGQFNRGQRVGKWDFLNMKSGDLFMEYNFSEDTLLYLNQTMLPDSFMIKTDKRFEYKPVDRPLVYTGYTDEIRILVGLNIHFPLEMMQSGKKGLCILAFRVDSLGNLKGAQVVSKFDPNIEQQINTIVTQLPGKFLPAIFNGKKVESLFYVRLNVGLPIEQFALDESVAYIKHIDVNFGSTVQKKITGKRYILKDISGDELDRLRR